MENLQLELDKQKVKLAIKKAETVIQDIDTKTIEFQLKISNMEDHRKLQVKEIEKQKKILGDLEKQTK